MPTTQETRLANFAAWVSRATEDLRALNGWTMSQLATRADVSKETIYAWRRANFKSGPPSSTKVANFAVNLGLDATEPYKLLGWLPGTPQPQPISSDIAQRLDRVLMDPNVDNREKALIKGMVARLVDPYFHQGPGTDRQTG